MFIEELDINRFYLLSGLSEIASLRISFFERVITHCGGRSSQKQPKMA